MLIWPLSVLGSTWSQRPLTAGRLSAVQLLVVDLLAGVLAPAEVLELLQ